MFRKPKRTAKGNFRSSTSTTTSSTIKSNKSNTDNDNDDDSDNDNNGTFSNNNPLRQQQQQQQQQKSQKENSDDSDDNNTTLLLQNAKKRTKLMGSKTTTTTTSSNTSNNDTSDIFSNNENTTTTASSTAMAMTQKDLVTSIADFHPENLLGKTTSGNNNTTNTTNTTNNPIIDGIGSDGIYRNNQRNKFLAGPIRASGNVRVTTRFDYQPDICKDYKETGFCGYGDTCIYLHDRSDTLNGWQIEQQWQLQQDLLKKQQNDEMLNFAQQHISNNSTTGSIDNRDNTKLEKLDDDGLPFACYICRDYFKEPVVTKCGHYFCEKCIIQSVQNNTTQNTNCPICFVDTGSVFNEPTKLFSKMRKVIGITQSKQPSAWKLYFNLYNNNSTTK